jgi:hydroxyacylglutathione hydrolase
LTREPSQRSERAAARGFRAPGGEPGGRGHDVRLSSGERSVSIIVDRYELGPIGTNCYVVRASRSADEAVVIDPSGDAAELRLELAGLGAGCAAILITHGHWDHLLGVADLAEGTGAPVYMAEDERALLENLSDLVPAGVHARPHTPDVLLGGDETLDLAGIRFETLRVPGHSPGHLAYHAQDSLFSGDVLFSGSVGRTDLPGGDWETLVETLRALTERFPPETLVYSGHGPPTTLGAELARNPFLAPLRAS